MESRDAIERRGLRLWCCTSWVIGSRFFTLEGVVSRTSPGGGPRTQSPGRKRASLPRPERMAQTAPAFGVSPSEKRMLDLITDHASFGRRAAAGPSGSSTPSTPDERQSCSSEATRRGNDRFYEEYVPVADDLYDEHLEELRKEGLI